VPCQPPRLYDTLFKSEDPGSLDEWLEDLNPESLDTLQGCVASPRLADAKVGSAGALGVMWVGSCWGQGCALEGEGRRA
jgi:hypothetical protein